MKIMSIVLIIFAKAFDANAGMLRVESNTFYTDRMGDDLRRERPFYEEFQSVFQDSERGLSFNFNFGLAYDFSQQRYNFDLNQLSGEVELVKDSVFLGLGRSFESHHLIKSSIMDSVFVDGNFWDKKLRTGAMMGVLRNFEFDEAHSEAPVVALYADFNTQEIYPLYAQVRYENVNYHSLGRAQYQTLKLGANKELKSSLNSKLYFNIEKGLSFSQSYRYEAGVDFYPRYDWSYGLQYQLYQRSSKEGLEKSIFNTFSLGEIKEYTAKVGKMFDSRLYGALSLQLDQYPLQQDQDTTGNRQQLSVSYQVDKLEIGNDLFHIKSFGGKAQGIRSLLDYAINDYFDLLLENEYIRYQKKTSAKNSAHAARVGMGSDFFRPFKSQVLAEYTRNNFYSEEWAVLVKLNFIQWSEI